MHATRATPADGDIGKASLFDVDAQATAHRQGASQLILRSVERRADNHLWLRYDVVPATSR
jgi:hypothetical protein